VPTNYKRKLGEDTERAWLFTGVSGTCRVTKCFDRAIAPLIFASVILLSLSVEEQIL